MRKNIKLAALPALLVASLWLVSSGCSGSPNPDDASASVSLPTSARLPGGSDYGWYRLAGCTREPYGVIYNFDKVPQVVNTQLRTMYANGQRRLRLPIYHEHGTLTGTVMDSSGGTLAPQFRANLSALLAAIKSIGFQEVEIGFFPIGANSPIGWPAWNETAYQENWKLISSLRPLFVRSGMPYRIDLLNEGMPPSNTPVFLQYSKRLWADYTASFGKSDTIGFSIVGDPARLSQLGQVYGNNWPDAFDIHFYANANQAFVQMSVALQNSQSPAATIPWIVGEAYYDDAQEAGELSAAIASTHQQVLYLTQWPVARNSPCSDVDTVPMKFNAYKAAGF